MWNQKSRLDCKLDHFFEMSDTYQPLNLGFLSTHLRAVWRFCGRMHKMSREDKKIQPCVAVKHCLAWTLYRMGEMTVDLKGDGHMQQR